MNKLLLGRFPVERSALFVCDMQEKFASSIKYFPEIVANSRKLLESAKIMDIPVVYTEQYPKGIVDLFLGLYTTAFILSQTNLHLRTRAYSARTKYNWVF